MASEFFFPALAAVFLLASWGLIILGRYLRDSLRLRRLELEREETRAMTPNDSSPERPASVVRQHTFTESAPPEQLLAWFRIVALCVGFFLVFGGVGALVAFNTAESFADLASIGWIPTLSGLGLLIFYRLSRDLGSQFGGE